MSLIRELKRRNVFRVAILYLVASWLILQVADVGVSLLGLPAPVGRVVFLILAIGFPLVLIFSWAFEITPGGVKKESSIERSDATSYTTARKLDTAVIVLLVLAIGVTVVDRLIPEKPSITDAASESGGSPVAVATETAMNDMSIAVLPFADLSPQKDQQYFTDGLSEELLNVLVRVDGLQVASRTSSFAYRDMSIGIPEIAQALNVAHILEGSVRKDGGRIRITAQLIETATDRHLWSENYDREFVDIFAIQDEIADAIVQALSRELGMPGSKDFTVEATTDNVDAYEMYLVARELYIRRRDLPESMRLIDAALELDRSFARGWELLAALEAIAEDKSYGIKREGADHPALAVKAAQKALELNPELSMPLAVLGIVASKHDRDLVAALKYFDASLQVHDKNSTAWLWRGLNFKYSGYLDEAIADFETCLAIDPAYRHCQSFMAESYLFKGMTDKALDLHEQFGEHVYGGASPSFVSIYARNGRRDLAMDIADRKMGRGNAPVVEWILAIENPRADNSAGLARLKAWARQAGDNVELPPQMLFSFKAYDEMLEIGEMQRRMLWHADAKEFRTTPQFKQLIRERGMLALWQARGFPPMCQASGEDDFECD
jgi:TolB-like protein